MQIETKQTVGIALLVVVVGVLLALSAPHASAQKVVDSFSGETLTLYADAEGTKAVGALKKSDFAPTQILQEAGEFGLIETAEGKFWINMGRARIKQGVAAACGPAAQKRALVASTGARGSNDGCK